MQQAVDSISEFKGIDSAGVYVLDSSSGEFVLDCHAGLSAGFIDSHSRIAPGSALHRVLSCDGNLFPDSPEESLFTGSPQVFLKGLFPLSLNETVTSVMFVASVEPGTIAEEIRTLLDTLLCMVKASISRITSKNRALISDREHSLLLEGIRYPVFALNDDLEVKYCNGVFRQLVHLEEGSIEVAGFSEVAGKRLQVCAGISFIVFIIR